MVIVRMEAAPSCLDHHKTLGLLSLTFRNGAETKKG